VKEGHQRDGRVSLLDGDLPVEDVETLIARGVVPASYRYLGYDGWDVGVARGRVTDEVRSGIWDGVGVAAQVKHSWTDRRLVKVGSHRLTRVPP
jgi:hypothetical protein